MGGVKGMKQPIGIYRKGPDGQCLVVGCKKTALYRAQGQKGYCSLHRSLAVTRLQNQDQFIEARAKWFY